MTFCQLCQMHKRYMYMHSIHLRAITVAKVATATVASGRIATCCLLANNIECRKPAACPSGPAVYDLPMRRGSFGQRCLFSWGDRVPCNSWFLRSPWIHAPKQHHGRSYRAHVRNQHTDRQTDRHRDRQTTLQVTIGRILFYSYRCDLLITRQFVDDFHQDKTSSVNITVILCTASYVSCKRDTARVCCWELAVQRPGRRNCLSIFPAGTALSSKPTARRALSMDGTDSQKYATMPDAILTCARKLT